MTDSQVGAALTLSAVGPQGVRAAVAGPQRPASPALTDVPGLELTLGAEEEFHLVDLETRRLVPRAPDLLERLPQDVYAAELQRCVVETNTRVVHDLDRLREELTGKRERLIDAAEHLGIGVASAGTVPLSLPAELEVTETPRYRRMLADYQLLAREQLICGMQVHVGVSDRDLAVALGQRVAPYLPVLLALTASSPFWSDGSDTGYASVRSLVWQRWPTSGHPGPLQDASDYDALVRDLVASGIISDPGMVYFDTRPSMHVPTLELRVCDATPLVDDAVLVAGLFRALVLREARAHRAGRALTNVPQPLHRAAMWRAARSGLDGDLVDAATLRPVPAREVLTELQAELRPELEELGDWEQVRSLTEIARHRAGSAARQRRALGRHGRLRDVVDLILDETRGAPPAAGLTPPRLPGEIRGYRPERYDEALQPDGSPRPCYVGVLQSLDDRGPRWLHNKEMQRDVAQRAVRATFRVSGEHQARTWPVDLIPRVVPGDEWAELGRGVVQRARALDAFLRDVYGDAQVIRDGVLPRAVVEGCAGWRPDEGRRPSPGTVRAHVCGFDIVTDGPGRWLVLEDNLRVPSGLGYAVSNRSLMRQVAADLPWPALLDAEAAPALLLDTLREAAPPRTDGDPDVVVLSDGPSDSAWFEHTLLADRMGVPLVGPADLRVVDRVAQRRDGRAWRRVDVIYLRMVEETLGSRDGRDQQPLEPALLDAVEAGNLTVANCLGNGVADDKTVFAYVPRLIEYYLGEKPLTDSVETYLCGDPAQREQVLDRLSELVVKPVDGYGGRDIFIGPRATDDERRRIRRRVLDDPQRWIAQELVELSTLPAFDGAGLEPRHVDLRVFVMLGSDARVAPAALTRVAPPGSLVVNSSTGGGAKDTWLLPVDGAGPVAPAVSGEAGGQRRGDVRTGR